MPSSRDRAAIRRRCRWPSETICKCRASQQSIAHLRHRDRSFRDQRPELHHQCGFAGSKTIRYYFLSPPLAGCAETVWSDRQSSNDPLCDAERGSYVPSSITLPLPFATMRRIRRRGCSCSARHVRPNSSSLILDGVTRARAPTTRDYELGASILAPDTLFPRPGSSRCSTRRIRVCRAVPTSIWFLPAIPDGHGELSFTATPTPEETTLTRPPLCLSRRHRGAGVRATYVELVAPVGALGAAVTTCAGASRSTAGESRPAAAAEFIGVSVHRIVRGRGGRAVFSGPARFLSSQPRSNALSTLERSACTTRARRSPCRRLHRQRRQARHLPAGRDRFTHESPNGIPRPRAALGHALSLSVGSVPRPELPVGMSNTQPGRRCARAAGAGPLGATSSGSRRWRCGCWPTHVAGPFTNATLVSTWRDPGTTTHRTVDATPVSPLPSNPSLRDSAYPRRVIHLDSLDTERVRSRAPSREVNSRRHSRDRLDSLTIVTQGPPRDRTTSPLLARRFVSRPIGDTRTIARLQHDWTRRTSTATRANLRCTPTRPRNTVFIS